MIPQWFGDCFYNSDNVMWNMAAANSAAWACMSWNSNPMVGGYSPYINFSTGCEYLTNPFYAWSQAGWNLFGGNNGPYDCQAPWTEMGWNWYQNRTPENKDKKEKEELSPDEKLAKVRYERLQKLLEDYSKNMANSGTDADVVNSETLKSLLKKSDKTTWAEKFEELLAIYNNTDYINKDDIKDFIIKSGTKFKYGLGTTTMEINKWLKEAGYQDFASDYQTKATSIKSDIDKLKDGDANISATEVSSDKILGVLSYYNSNNPSEDFATAFVNKYKNLNKDESKDTALGSIESIIKALTAKAEAIKGSTSLDNDTKIALGDAISAMSGQIVTSGEGGLRTLKDPDAFAKAFNTLYAMTRLAAAVIAEKSLDEQYGSIDATIAKFVTEQTKKDLEDEKLTGVNISGLKVKRTESNTRVIQNNSSSAVINTKSNVDKIKTLVDEGIITEVPDATCEDKQVYLQTLYNGKTRWLILKDDGKFYHVVKVNDEYTVKDGAAGIEAKTIKDEGEKITKRKEAEEELTTNDKAKLAQEKHQYTENGVNYAVYSIRIGEETHYYILNDDNKLQEVNVSGSTVTKKSNVKVQTVDEIAISIKNAEEKASNAIRDEKMKTISLKENSEAFVRVLNRSISQGSWASKAGNFESSLTKQIDRLFVWNESCGYTRNEFNAAKKTLVSYYKGAFKALENVRWNQATKDGVEASIKLEDDALILGKDSFTYKKYSYQDGRLITETITVTDKNKTQSTCLARKYDSSKFQNYLDAAHETSSPTGMYVACSYTYLAQNNFTIDIDTGVMLEKFKSFLP